MNETDLPGNCGEPLCEDEPGIQRAGRGWAAMCIGNGQPNQAVGGVTGALNCMHDQQAILCQTERKYIVRRLTPLECCRLQGFPDWWTDGVEGSDSAKYKLWGNGIALPCAVDVLGRITRTVEG